MFQLDTLRIEYALQVIFVWQNGGFCHTGCLKIAVQTIDIKSSLNLQYSALIDLKAKCAWTRWKWISIVMIYRIMFTEYSQISEA